MDYSDKSKLVEIIEKAFFGVIIAGGKSTYDLETVQNRLIRLAEKLSDQKDLLYYLEFMSTGEDGWLQVTYRSDAIDKCIIIDNDYDIPGEMTEEGYLKIYAVEIADDLLRLNDEVRKLERQLMRAFKPELLELQEKLEKERRERNENLSA